MRVLRTDLISAVLSAACCVSPLVSGCQIFTAGETVSEPEPGQVRAAGRGAEKQPVDRPPAHANVNPGDPHAGLGDAAPELAKASHILIRYAGSARAPSEVTRTKEEAQKLAQEVAQKAKAPGADFAGLADKYTEDPSGKGRGGSLGSFPKGRMVPEFDKATFELAPGGVSDVVETSFGFHIIRREQ